MKAETENIRLKLLKKAKLVVLKIGTNVLTSGGRGLDVVRIKKITAQVGRAAGEGRKLVIVSSGAITAGMGLLGMKSKPRTIPEEQAAAAVGQGHLMSVYNKCFSELGLTAAQVLLTQADLRDRKRYVNARNTMMTLLRKGVIPVVNENDTVAVDELIFGDRFGDNDILSALVAGLVEADALIMLTDVEGLLSQDGKVIGEVAGIDAGLRANLRKGKSAFGKGGMENKLEAAKIATDSGQVAVIASGARENVLTDILSGLIIGTVFAPKRTRMYARKRWMAFTMHCKGRILIDEGACDALKKGRSLLPGGVIEAEGGFRQGDAVFISNERGEELARGIANYSHEEVKKIKGLKSSAIEGVLGAKPYEEVVHRNNMAVIGEEADNGSRERA